LLEGEARIGKAAIWRAATEVARERGFGVLAARPSEAEQTPAFAALADLLREGAPPRPLRACARGTRAAARAPCPARRTLPRLSPFPPLGRKVHTRAAETKTACEMRELPDESRRAGVVP
jgi:hypothetical protein